MKKLSLVLCLVFAALALVSCSDRNTQKKPEKVALEHVYLTEKLAIPDGVDVYNLILSGDNVYLQGSKSEEREENGEMVYDYYDVVYSTDKELSTVTEFYTHQNNYFYDEKTMESRNTYLGDVTSDMQGGVWISIVEYYSKPLDDSYNEWLNESNTYYYHYAADGTRTREVNCKDIISSVPDIDSTETKQFYVSSLSESADGKLYITTNERIIVVDADGKFVQTLELEDIYPNACKLLENGNLRTTVYDWSGDRGVIKIMEYNLKSNKLETTATINGDYSAIIADDGQIYYNDNYVVSRVDAYTGDMTPMLDWINSDINCDRIFQMQIHNDEFYMFEWDNNYEKRSLLHLTPASDGEVVERYVMTLAANYIGSDLKNMIIDYNRSSAEYRITVKAYGWDEGATEQFDMDLLGGDVPDIISTDQLNVEKYATKNIFADLGVLLSEDEDINMDDLLENVVEAAKINGKLYRMPISFSVRTLIGKKSIVGDGNSWTWDELLALKKKYPDAEYLSEMDRNGIMEGFLPLVIDNFIDYNAGKSNFTDGDFAKFLEFAKSFPANIDWNTFYENVDWEEYEKRYRENRTLLQMGYVSSLSGNSYQQEQFGEEVNYIGFPSANGKGAVLTFGTQFAIGESSPYKKQAWDFIKMVLEENYQREYVWELPVNKTVFEEKKTEAINNANGIYEDDIVYDDDIYFEEEYTTENVIAKADDFVSTLPIYPEEEVIDDNAEYRAALVADVENKARIATTANRLARYNDPAIEIITNEVSAYFDSKKSLEETCKIIESRVNLYLAENR